MKIKKMKKHGRWRWQLDLRPVGQGRKFFPSLESAKNYRAQIQREVAASGRAILALTDEDKRAALAAKEQYPDVPFVEAMSFYARHHNPADSKTLAEAAEEFQTMRINSGLREKSLTVVQSDVRSMVKFLGESLPVNSVLSADIDRHINSGLWSQRTKLVKLTNLKVFFGYCTKQGWTSENPCKKAARPLVPEKEPEVLTPDQCRSLLRQAREDDPELIPSLILGMFCGLRPSEVDRIEWESIYLERGYVEVIALKVLSRRRRLVNLSDNAKAWFKIGGQLPPFRRGRRVLSVRRAANLPWPQDCLRHSFASYHLAQHGSADQTATQLGHASTQMLFAHYRNLVTPEDAKAFWGIFPE